MKNQFDETLHLFGAKLRSIRKSRGISQEELSDICCLDRTYISGLELGKRNPTLKVLASIAHHLNISLSELLSGVNNKE